MKLRSPGKLRNVKSQVFSCGMFGVCSDVVLSPSSPSRAHLPDHPPANNATICSCDEKENIAGGEAVEPKVRFHRVPSSTQWELALKMHNRSLKGRCSGSPASDPCLVFYQGVDQPVESLVMEVSSSSCSVATLRALRVLGEESLENRNVMVEMGLHGELLGLLDSDNSDRLPLEVVQEGFSLVVVLASDDRVVECILQSPSFSKVVERFLRTGSSSLQVNAATLLVKLYESENEEFFRWQSGILEAVIALLKVRDERVFKSGIKSLLALCLWKENRSLAAKAGAVALLLEILGESKGVTAERCLATLELLSTTSEGRDALRTHALAVPLLLNMILRVSDRGTEYAAGVLCAVCTADNVEVLETACQSRASTLLLLLMQSHCTERARRKALKLLKVFHNHEEMKVVGMAQ